MNSALLRSGVAALALGAVLVSSMGLPAKADTTSTQNIIYGAAAAAAAFTLINVEHKHQLANSIEGYLPNGSTVYQDGHIVSPNGQSWYPSQNGQSVACNNNYCTLTGGNGYNGYGYNANNNGYDNGYNNRYRNDSRIQNQNQNQIQDERFRDDNSHWHHGN